MSQRQPPSETDRLFTYGSLMCPEIMHRVSGTARHGTAALLKDYRRGQLRGQTYPAIIPHPGAGVRGILYHDLSCGSLRRLDAFEGAMYRREQVTLDWIEDPADGDPTPDAASPSHARQKQYQAWAYVLLPAFRSQLLQHDWSFEHFLARGKAQFERDFRGFDRF